MTRKVINPGRLNNGPGPDYRDAVFELDGRRCRGDVELHVRASFFRSHGHDVDHAYDGVAMDVVDPADEGPETALASGGRTPVASFAPWLLGRTGELRRWRVAAEPPLWRDPCADAAGRFGTRAVEQALRSAGFRRFRARAERLAADASLRGEDGALWSALLDCLGVGGDREGFRRLAAAFPARLASDVYDVLGGSWPDRLAAGGCWPRPSPVADCLATAEATFAGPRSIRAAVE